MATPYQTQQQSWTAEERDQMILDHLPQVRLIASRIHERLPKHVSLDDLVSAGVIGLIAAVDNFDPSRNVKLRTFAEHKIRGYILNSIGKLDGAPRARKKTHKEVQRAIADAGQRLGANPGSEDIASELNLTIEEYFEVLNDLQFVTLGGLETSAEGEEGNGLLRYLADPREETPARSLERKQLHALIVEALKEMPEVERVVLNMYYMDELNLREIASVMNLHLTRISQIKTQAILGLRTRLTELWPGKADLQ
jgi:RNA polymerase sigma factor for flagellar operon FliA